MKKIAICLLVLMSLGLTAWAESEIVDGQIWYYSIENGEAVLEGNPDGEDFFIGTDVVVPERLGGCPVVSISRISGYIYRSITSIALPSKLRTLDFNGYKSLKQVTFPNGNTEITEIRAYTFSGCTALERVDIPGNVKVIRAIAFNGCSSLKTISIPESVEVIESGAFNDCVSLGEGVVVVDGCVLDVFGEYPSTVEIPANVRLIAGSAFRNCTLLSKIVIPEGVKSIGERAFMGCSSLKTVSFPSTVADVGRLAFSGCLLKTVCVAQGDEDRAKKLIAAAGADISDAVFVLDFDDIPIATPNIMTVVVTNVVVHYICNSYQPSFAKPVSQDAGFVNVITEVKGSNVAVPETWKDNFPGFVDKYGANFGLAVVSRSGKKDASGRDMLVWEDYVAGTDPTKEDDLFKASVTMVNNKPVVSWTPELDSERAALRKYTIYGKRRLSDDDWAVVDGDADEFNFFKVTVEMK